MNPIRNFITKKQKSKNSRKRESRDFVFDYNFSTKRICGDTKVDYVLCSASHYKQGKSLRISASKENK